MITIAQAERRISVRKRRVARPAAVVAIVAAALALIAAVAFAFFSDSSSSPGNSLALGTVALNLNSPQTTTCVYNALNPGDLTGSTTCALSVTYTGTLSAYVSLTVQIQSKAGVGGHTLYDPTNGNGLTLSISDGHHSFTVPAGAGSTGGSCPVGFTCWTAPNDLAAWYSGSTPELTFANGDSATWTVTPLFPNSVTNAYQGATATVSLTAEAVQSPGNTIPGSCTTSTIGQSCPPGGGFAWS